MHSILEHELSILKSAHNSQPELSPGLEKGDTEYLAQSLNQTSVPNNFRCPKIYAKLSSKHQMSLLQDIAKDASHCNLDGLVLVNDFDQDTKAGN